MLYLYCNIRDIESSKIVCWSAFLLCIYSVFVCMTLHVLYEGLQMEINILLHLLIFGNDYCTLLYLQC